MSKVIDLTGQKFGRLTVIERAPNTADHRTVWACRCDCGNSHKVESHSLRRELVKSCGCLRTESSAARIRDISKPGAESHNWKGGQKNVGSVAWASRILSGQKIDARKHGYVPPNTTPKDVAAMWNLQKGMCACTGKPFGVGKNRPVLDHCHKTGEIRGFVLCRINRAMGCLEDDSIDAYSVSKYLA